MILGENMKDKNFFQKQKNALSKEKNSLEMKIKKLEGFPEYGNADDDNAREFSDFEKNQSIEFQLKELLKKVNLALKAIEKGTYGKCSKCKKEIESGRLISMPYADICVTCNENEKK